ncbi:MAG: hypothetical protein ACPLZY_04995, partial [Candidatus Norongarragalinales archaeon]
EANLQETSERATEVAGAVNSKLNEIKNLIEETTAVLQQLTSDLTKLKEATSKILRTEVAQQSLTEKLENLVSKIDGVALRLEARQPPKELYIEKVIKFLEQAGFTIYRGSGRKEPRILAKVGDKKVFVATCKTYTLTSQTRQRTIYLDRLPEAEHAKRLHVDLVLFIVNTANERIWVCHVLQENIEEVGTITTPPWLVEPSNEADERCKQSMQQLLQFYIKQQNA